MRALVFSVIGVSLMAASAAADTPAAHAPLRVSSLPVGTISAPPPPAKVTSANGRAEGFVLRRESHDYSIVTPSKQDPRRTSRASAACFSTANNSLHRFRMRSQLGPSAFSKDDQVWEPQSMSQVVFGSRGDLQVIALHREELVQRGDQASLETHDAILDSRSQGVRTIDKRSLPMVKVGEFVSGVQVFAMQGDDKVEFVVSVPADSLGLPDTMVADITGRESMPMTSQCQHIRVTAPIKKGEGTAATVKLRVIDRDPNGAPSQADQDGMVVQSMRTLAIHLSTSWLSGDREATVSATAGWHGPSERRRISLENDRFGF